MTYTVTKTYTKQDDITFWPWEQSGYRGGLDTAKSDGRLISHVLSEDGNTATTTQEWTSKSDYEDVVKFKNDATLRSIQELWVTYMALNNISCRVVQEDGTVKVFNSSTQLWELE
jgi:hypothetical protein